MTTGVKLTKMSQSLLYHHLKEKGEMSRQATSRSIQAIEVETKDLFGLTPSLNNIWKSMRNRDFSKKVRDFLWKHAHGIFRLGAFWNNVPGLEDRGVCPTRV